VRVLHVTVKSDTVTLPSWRRECNKYKEAARDVVSPLHPEAMSQWLGERDSADNPSPGQSTAWPWIEDGKKRPW